MGEYDIAGSSRSDLDSATTTYSVNSQTTDGPSESGETTWLSEHWHKYLGYYKEIPEIKKAIDAKATWCIGKGFTASEETEILLGTITGWGKDTFNQILQNAIRVCHIGGDFFAEIILDSDDNLLNLKPLDPGSIQIVVDRQGRIKRYEQINKGSKRKRRFKPELIFHLARDRVADEIHGVSVIEAVERLILYKNEAMKLHSKGVRYNVVPRHFFHLDTDDSTKIANFKAELDKAIAEGENIYIPKDAVVPEVVAMSNNAIMNPIPWIILLDDKFYETVGTPKVIIGNSNNITEAAAKIVYLAW